MRVREREMRRGGHGGKEKKKVRAEVEKGEKLRSKGGKEKEIYFYGRDSDVLFLHDRIFCWLEAKEKKKKSSN